MRTRTRTLCYLVVFGLITLIIAKADAALTQFAETQARITELQEEWHRLEAIQADLHAQANALRALMVIPVTVTNYNPVAGQTDGAPCRGAAMVDLCLHPEPVIALSQDLVGRDGKKPFTYGDKVILTSSCASGTYTVLDTMNKRFSNYADVFHKDAKDNFGRCSGTISKYVP